MPGDAAPACHDIVHHWRLRGEIERNVVGEGPVGGDGNVSAVAHGDDVRASDGHEVWIGSPGSPAMEAVGEDPGDIPNVRDSEYQGIVGVQVMQHGRPSIQAAGRGRKPGGLRDQGALRIDRHVRASRVE